jgi:hypothetical protein
MTPTRRHGDEHDLDAGLILCLIALGFALGGALVAYQALDGVRDELRRARGARERSQQTASDLRRQLDGALGELHDAATERDHLRQQVTTDPPGTTAE